jgi:magnesium chelatase subunit I
VSGAQWLLPRVEVPESVSFNIAKVCARLRVDGIRGDIVVDRAARAFAALKGASVVDSYFVEKVLPLCLRHRVRSAPGCDAKELVLEAYREVFQPEIEIREYSVESQFWLETELNINPVV